MLCINKSLYISFLPKISESKLFSHSVWLCAACVRSTELKGTVASALVFYDLLLRPSGQTSDVLYDAGATHLRPLSIFPNSESCKDKTRFTSTVWKTGVDSWAQRGETRWFVSQGLESVVQREHLIKMAKIWTRPPTIFVTSVFHQHDQTAQQQPQRSPQRKLCNCTTLWAV